MKLPEFTVLEGGRVRYKNGEVKPLTPEGVLLVEVLRELQVLNGRLSPQPAPPPPPKKEVK